MPIVRTWVAVGNSGAIVRSTDNGATFIAATTVPATGDFREVKYGNGVWLATGKPTPATARTVYRSTDGDIWAAVTIPGTTNGGEWTNLTYDAFNNRWMVASGGAPAEVAISTDNGLNFASNSPTGIPGAAFVFGLTSDDVGNFILGTNQARIYSSSNGTSFTETDGPLTGAQPVVQFSKISTGGTIILGSNGAIHTSQDAGATYSLNAGTGGTVMRDAVSEGGNDWLVVGDLSGSVNALQSGNDGTSFAGLGGGDLGPDALFGCDYDPVNNISAVCGDGDILTATAPAPNVGSWVAATKPATGRLWSIAVGDSFQALSAQVVSGFGNGPLVLNFPVAPTDGNSLVAAITINAGETVSSITQSGVTWVNAGAITNTISTSTELWYAIGVTSAGTAVTINTTSNEEAVVRIVEYINIGGFDQAATNLDNFSSEAETGTIVTIGDNKLLVAALGMNDNALFQTPLDLLGDAAPIIDAQIQATDSLAYLESTTNTAGSHRFQADIISTTGNSGVLASFNVIDLDANIESPIDDSTNADLKQDIGIRFTDSSGGIDPTLISMRLLIDKVDGDDTGGFVIISGATVGSVNRRVVFEGTATDTLMSYSHDEPFSSGDVVRIQLSGLVTKEFTFSVGAGDGTGIIAIPLSNALDLSGVPSGYTAQTSGTGSNPTFDGTEMETVPGAAGSSFIQNTTAGLDFSTGVVIDFNFRLVAGFISAAPAKIDILRVFLGGAGEITVYMDPNRDPEIGIGTVTGEQISGSAIPLISSLEQQICRLAIIGTGDDLVARLYTGSGEDSARDTVVPTLKQTVGPSTNLGAAEDIIEIGTITSGGPVIAFSLIKIQTIDEAQLFGFSTVNSISPTQSFVDGGGRLTIDGSFLDTESNTPPLNNLELVGNRSLDGANIGAPDVSGGDGVTSPIFSLRHELGTIGLDSVAIARLALPLASDAPNGGLILSFSINVTPDSILTNTPANFDRILFGCIIKSNNLAYVLQFRHTPAGEVKFTASLRSGVDLIGQSFPTDALGTIIEETDLVVTANPSHNLRFINDGSGIFTEINGQLFPRITMPTSSPMAVTLYNHPGQFTADLVTEISNMTASPLIIVGEENVLDTVIGTPDRMVTNIPANVNTGNMDVSIKGPNGNAQLAQALEYVKPLQEFVLAQNENIVLTITDSIIKKSL